jgi:hypothetical protein
VAIEITGLPLLDWSHQTAQLVQDLIKERAHENGCLPGTFLEGKSPAQR